jgi:predicted Fe-S protein YdhL (DUF1289 family)
MFTIPKFVFLSILIVIEPCESLLQATKTGIGRRTRTNRSLLHLQAGPTSDALSEQESLGQHNVNEDAASPSRVSSTPCVRICRYNSNFYDGAVCIGCFREAFEIGNWVSFGRQERRYALQDALERLSSLDCDSNQSFEGSISRMELEKMIHDRNP